MKMVKYFLVGIVILFVLLAAGYGIKVRMGINLFDTFHLSDYWPFNLLIPEAVIDEPGPGYARIDDFNSADPFGFWITIYSGEKGVAKLSKDPKGSNGTGCLLITCSQKTDWAVNAGYFVKVKPGDKFHYEAKLKIGSPSGKAGISFVAFDKDRKTPKYDFIKQEAAMDKIGTWQVVSLDFTVEDPENGYIVPRIWGYMAGLVRYDDIVLRTVEN